MLFITNNCILYIIGTIIYKGNIIINVSNLFTKQVQMIHKIFIDIIPNVWYYIITARDTENESQRGDRVENEVDEVQKSLERIAQKVKIKKYLKRY